MRQLHLIVIPLLLSGCGLKGGWLMTVGPDYQKPTPPVAKHWYAPAAIAHQGEVSTLSHWWEKFNDPVLSRLLAAAQTESATIANAKARIGQARASLIGADSMFIPKLDASLSSGRSSFSFGQDPFLRTQHQLDVQSSWEIDLFGGLARQQEASISQLESRTAAWHDARVAVAAELANAYLAYRYCEVQKQLAQTDADSRLSSATLLDIAAQAGLRNSADAALAHASASEGKKSLLQQEAQCERSIKGLVAMTGLEETQLRQWLAPSPGQEARLPSPPPFTLNAIPAKMLMQRPDVAAAERDMAEASAKIGVEQAKRFPKLSLSGNITPVFQNINSAALTLAETWSIGPTLSLPLFDAGKRAANVEAAKADYIAATSQFRATVRTAVKEVEDALVRLASAGQQLPQARSAAQGYQTNYQSAQKLYEIGLGNLLDAETARRSMVAADLAIQELEQEKTSAWIALYRAVGGGWEENTP
ncbi:MAG: efflux transporter outer membrane subunit [Methylovulum miyakonense]|uniref:efflux transporter outer membrane subunit n=1 Tax=Methylovulum miyakonense TaxID=645578 RepID=UPI003BB6C87B